MELSLKSIVNEPESASESEMVDVIRLRYWHHIFNELLKRKKFKIPIHLGFGHEAAAVALDRCVGKNDAICLTHRNVAYNLARSKSLDVVLRHYQLESFPGQAELMGSMNLAVGATNIAYTSSILCNNLPVAAGIAMNRRCSSKDGVIFVVTGDGAIEEGAFWETLVFARSHHLKLVIVVENNDYSMSSTIVQRRCELDLSQVCAGVGIGYGFAKGAEVGSARATIETARNDAMNGNPALVELQISTFNQHAGPTPGWPDDPLRISLEDGLLLKNELDDPLYHVRQAMGEAVYQGWADKIIKEDQSGKYLY